MNFEEFKNEFIKKAQKNNIEINEENIDKFYNYMKEIISWNEKINLTAITDEKEFIVKHYLDSLTISNIIKDYSSVIDIGTGAGFPGIPLKLNFPEKKFTLIDSINKKLSVIKDITSNYDLKDLEIIHSRAEDLARKEEYREKYDIATTRAVSGMQTILEYMLPFIKVGGLAICMKGPNYKEELDNSYKAITKLGGKLEKVDTFNINGEYERNIILIRKIEKTSMQYPRVGNKPLKEPIM